MAREWSEASEGQSMATVTKRFYTKAEMIQRLGRWVETPNMMSDCFLGRELWDEFTQEWIEVYWDKASGLFWDSRKRWAFDKHEQQVETVVR